MSDPKIILVVDDEPRYLSLVQINLETAGYEAITAMNGQQAVDAVAEHKPDIVLLDVMMPVMDGFTACERIREFSSIPIIILTAKGEERDRVRGLDAGADDYIIKPFSAQELLARVRAVLRRAERETVEGFHEPVFNHAGLEIDLARAQVNVEGEEVALTATEYRLLQTLANNTGRVLSPEDLLTSVWGTEYKDDKEILWVCLSRLRQKIEPDPKNPIHIITKQGIGYMMPSLE
jgi:DNA-binding response OmpR family regulator